MYRLLSQNTKYQSKGTLPLCVIAEEKEEDPLQGWAACRRSVRGERLDYSTNQLLILRNCPSDIMQILRLTGERLSSIPAQEVPLTLVSRCVCIHGTDFGPPPSFIRGQLFLTRLFYMNTPRVLDASRTVE